MDEDEETMNQEYIVTGISDINKKKKKIFINYEIAFSLYNSEIRKYEIELDKPISQEIYNEIVDELLPKRAKLRAMNLLVSRDLTEYTLREKLKEGFYPESVIDIAINYVKSYGYIDDRRYIENYILAKSNTKSKFQITSSLLLKGIHRDMIANVYEEINKDNNNETERLLIEKLIYKKIKDINCITMQEKTKLVAYLLRKGFQIELINSIIYEIVNK